MRDLQKAFLIFRSAEWALEVITLRKRTGDVALTITTSKGHVLLRIEALTDDPKMPVTLTPKESEEANALRQGLAAVAGTFIVDEGPTGFSLALTVPALSRCKNIHACGRFCNSRRVAHCQVSVSARLIDWHARCSMRQAPGPHRPETN